MSRTTLCIMTATGLALLSAGMAVTRCHVMGQETAAPSGPGNYKVTMVMHGRSTGDARVITACPLDCHRQHVFGENFASEELSAKVTEVQQGERRQIQWQQRLGISRGPFQARYEFLCTLEVHQPTTSMARLNKVLHAPPRAGEHLGQGPYLDPHDPAITALAQQLALGQERSVEQTRALFDYVSLEIHKEPGVGGPGASAAECLQQRRGDALAKSRLLAALCRNRGIPARLVTGLTLAKRSEQKAHVWVEAWLHDAWLPLCPFHHHFGRVPPTYLVFAYGDMTMVRGRNVRDLEYSCLVEPRTLAADLRTGQPSPLRRFFTMISLYALPPSEWRLVEFLLLLPVAALIICIYRNLIGLQSFGTFAPALIGLAFRELESLPGILVFVSIVLIGWGLRRVLDRYHLLQVPRTAFLLSLVVIILIGAILAANYQDLVATRYISLFPMVILTGMIERFWTLETEDGTASSFRTLLNTMIMAATISLVLSIPALVHHLVTYPETIGLIMALQLLLGRYTGYRLSELLRFRDLIELNPRTAEARR